MAIFIQFVLFVATSVYCIEATGVFFHAMLSQDVHLSLSQTVVFDAIVTNHGDGYNSTTGEFKAPYDGTYYFTSTFLKTHTSPNLGLILENRGNTLAQGYASGGGDHTPGSMSTVVYLKKGDIVKVTHHPGFGGQTMRGASWSAFTGYLI